MDKKTDQKIVALKPNKKLVFLGAVILIVVLLIIFVGQLVGPKRSVAAYCEVYKTEKTRLAKLPGNTWPSGVFNDALGDAGEFVTSFDKLEGVAPKEVVGDVTALKAVYKKIHDEPAQAVNASLSGSSADDNLRQWTKQNCEN
jgi:hypothetical protein